MRCTKHISRVLLFNDSRWCSIRTNNNDKSERTAEQELEVEGMNQINCNCFLCKQILRLVILLRRIQFSVSLCFSI